jgi:hypothetical protein
MNAMEDHHSSSIIINYLLMTFLLTNYTLLSSPTSSSIIIIIIRLLAEAKQAEHLQSQAMSQSRARMKGVSMNHLSGLLYRWMDMDGWMNSIELR